ncbi:MAG: c-type cytochrome [Chakrabartia sp.]
MLRCAPLILALALVAPAQAQQAPLAEAGKRVFLKCAACHTREATAPARFGPNLGGVVGRKVASLPGYAYSPALKRQKFIWTDAQLDKWLKNPRALVPGTAMSFPGLADAADRKAVIAYLKSPTP